MSETKPRLRTRRNATNSECRTAHRYTKQSKNFLQKNNNGDRFHPSTSEATAAHIHNKIIMEVLLLWQTILKMSRP